MSFPVCEPRFLDGSFVPPLFASLWFWPAAH